MMHYYVPQKGGGSLLIHPKSIHQSADAHLSRLPGHGASEEMWRDG